jgi:site-specific DNA-methyltransferase (adenine-specific)
MRKPTVKKPASARNGRNGRQASAKNGVHPSTASAELSLAERYLLGNLVPAYSSAHGALFSGDCLTMLPSIPSDCIDMVFADPPFNIGKKYGESVNDRLSEADYLEWCYRWTDECVRVLKAGGSLFIYNLPKWSVRLANHLLDRGMQFRDWIVVDIKLGLPIPKRLYPSHYSLLYFSKGKPSTFHNIRRPIEACRHCGGDIKDYGGHRNAINPNGLNLTDVWDDIPPVRHWKFKSRKRRANALSTKLLERIIEMSTNPGDVVLDPFGGSGTTFAVCEKRGRRWIGIDIESAEVIIERLDRHELGHYKNADFVEA